MLYRQDTDSLISLLYESPHFGYWAKNTSRQPPFIFRSVYIKLLWIVETKAVKIEKRKLVKTVKLAQTLFEHLNSHISQTLS